MEIFIPNTNKRYSISDKGIVFSHYRYKANGKKWLIKKPIKKGKNTKSVASPTVSIMKKGSPHGMVHKRCVFVHTLMTKLFKIKPPDNKHLYDTTSRNGDFYDCSIKNITFKIRLKDKDEKHYPQPFYNKDGVIIAKICSYCGLKKDINCFSLQKGGISRKTYRNMTDSCRGKKQWISLKSDAERLQKAIALKNKWVFSESGIAYRRKFWKEYNERNKKELNALYIQRYFSLNEVGLKPQDLTKEFIDLARKYIITYNKIKQLKQLKNGNN